jgi:PAS domain S-box-containing protein
MAKKTTYEELKKRCKKLEKEVLERRRAEELLRDSEAKYRDPFENAPIGMFQSTVDGKVLNVNKAYAQIFGYESPEDVIASVADTARQVDVQPGQWKRLVEIILKQNRLFNFENHCVRKDGSVFIGNLHVRAARNNDGSVRYLEGFVEDITERKRAKESLELSNIAMLDMVESIGDGFFSLDDEFVVTYFNRAAEQLSGRKSWEVLGHNYFEAFPEFKGSIFEDRFTEGLNEGVRLSFETYFDGKPYENWYEVRVYPQKNGISVYFQVTTERKRAEEEKKRLEAQLQQAQKMKAISTLAGGIANDFNNLLSVIEGNASLMLFDIDASHPHYENLKSIEKQAHGASKLSAQLLGYAGKGRYEVKRLDLNQLARETSEAFGRNRKEITIHRELADDLSPTEADRGQIEQVLSNLYVNAAEAMPGGGDLFLKTRNVTHKDMEGKLYDPKPGKYLMLTVADTGVGIDEKTMEHIFEPFFTTKKRDRNAGLGLSSAYGIIEGHGGYIDVASVKGHEPLSIFMFRHWKRESRKLSRKR